MPYYRFVCSDSVISCVLTHNDSLVLVRQYRHNLETFTNELPAGSVDKFELPADAVSREFMEETGLQADFVYLGAYRLLMNRMTNFEHIYFGYSDEVFSAEQEAGVDVIFVPRRLFFDFVKSGQYQQLAGLGIMQIISAHMGADFLSCPKEAINIWFKKFKGEK